VKKKREREVESGERVALLWLVIFYVMKFNSIRFHETPDGVITAAFVARISRGLRGQRASLAPVAQKGGRIRGRVGRWGWRR